MTEIIRSTRVDARRIRVEERVVPATWLLAKRCIDVAVALVVLGLTLPLVVLAMIGIFVVSGGSPIFTQERVGHNGRVFRMFKLRTMISGAHLLHAQMQPLSEVDGPVFKMRADPRLHALGSLLRRTSIDEIPNFINVLRGDMAAVGPRPPLPCEVEDYDDFALARLAVKPGVTCLWQISGRSHLSFEQWMALDNDYIKNWTPLMDLQIVLQTIPAVIRGIGAH